MINLSLNHGKETVPLSVLSVSNERSEWAWDKILRACLSQSTQRSQSYQEAIVVRNKRRHYSADTFCTWRCKFNAEVNFTRKGMRVCRDESFSHTGKKHPLSAFSASRVNEMNGREENNLRNLSLAEYAELKYLHQNKRKICSDETTHPSGKVV